MRSSDAQREARRRWKVNHPEAVKAERKRYRRSDGFHALQARKRVARHSFLAIDGEGWTRGRHEYHMIVTSDPTRYLTSPEGLTTEQCLGFIADLPRQPGQNIVAFYFDYDVTMILRDMALSDPDACSQLFDVGRDKPVWWRGFGIKYRPHKSFSVKRWTDDGNGQWVTIHDTGTFFQCTFVKALTKFNIADDETLTRIQGMKDQRATFTPEHMDGILRYSQEECRLLVSLMERVRDLAELAGLNASPYEGPGGLASRALSRDYTIARHKATMDNMPQDVHDCAGLAMYGGRFETLAVGPIGHTPPNPGIIPVYEYDLHSAYPFAMANLPCLVHGRWVRTRKADGVLNLTHIQFRDDRIEDWGLAYALPIRRKSGALQYPREGAGWYWQTEYEEVDTLDYTRDYCWSWFPSRCPSSCRKPFYWIHDLFAQRERMEAQDEGSGICLKLALNTLYGKCAQTRPLPGRWLNFVYASLITSQTRKRMYGLYAGLPARSGLMFATDAIFTTAPLETSHGLGGLEHANTYNQLCIVQPGLYFDYDEWHFKTRGIPKRYIQSHGQGIWAAAYAGVEYPINVTQFRGLRLGLHSRNPETIGQWIDTTRTIETRTPSKRDGELEIDGIIWTKPTRNTNPQGESVWREFSQTASVMGLFNDIDKDDETEGWYDE